MQTPVNDPKITRGEANASPALIEVESHKIALQALLTPSANAKSQLTAFGTAYQSARAAAAAACAPSPQQKAEVESPKAQNGIEAKPCIDGRMGESAPQPVSAQTQQINQPGPQSTHLTMGEVICIYLCP